MSRRTIVIGSQLFTAATVFAAAAAFAVSAHADTQPPVCEQYGFPGDVLFRQGDGFHTSFASTGTQALGRAVATNTSRPMMNGTVGGGFTGPRHFDLTIRWDDGTVGRYIGDVGNDAKAYGTANGAYFDSVLPLGCFPTQLGSPNVGASEIEVLVNDARTHPESYPPRGDPAGAAVAACDGPFESSPALADTAASHNDFLASQPIEWVNTLPNMHATTPDGTQLSTDAGGPIDQAGFHSLRAQIAATGFPTAAAVIQAWMQDDAPLNWAHRNIILNCGLSQAGAAHLQGGPGGHYWTVNMGNP
jgi:hypothetical protein